MSDNNVYIPSIPPWQVDPLKSIQDEAIRQRIAAPVVVDNGGVKHDQEKDPWHLVPWDAIREVVKVLKFGATKYAPRNWERGMDYHRCFRATINHMTAWWDGEDNDPETGISHLAHAACNCLFLMAYKLRGIGVDNRPKY